MNINHNVASLIRMRLQQCNTFKMRKKYKKFRKKACLCICPIHLFTRKRNSLLLERQSFKNGSLVQSLKFNGQRQGEGFDFYSDCDRFLLVTPLFHVLVTLRQSDCKTLICLQRFHIMDYHRGKIKSLMSDRKLNSHSFHQDLPSLSKLNIVNVDLLGYQVLLKYH